MDHADARNNRDAAQRSIWLHEENKRLAAENAELKATDHYQRSLDEMHLRYNVETELAAANATLERLREVVPPHGYWPIDDTEHDNITAQIHAILYPPETTP